MDNKGKTVKLKTFFYLTVKPAPLLDEIEVVVKELEPGVFYIEDWEGTILYETPTI